MGIVSKTVVSPFATIVAKGVGKSFMSLNFELIGRRVKEVRMLKRMTQAELAEQTRMSVAYISHIETARKKASLTALVSIANVLDITVDTLLIGNQCNDQAEYQLELALLIDDCNIYERRFILEMAFAAKSNLRNNRLLQGVAEKA